MLGFQAWVLGSLSYDLRFSFSYLPANDSIAPVTNQLPQNSAAAR